MAHSSPRGCHKTHPGSILWERRWRRDFSESPWRGFAAPAPLPPSKARVFCSRFDGSLLMRPRDATQAGVPYCWTRHIEP